MNKDTHFLDWRRARMVCGKRAEEIWSLASFWKYVTCQDCIRDRKPEHTEP